MANTNPNVTFFVDISELLPSIHYSGWQLVVNLLTWAPIDALITIRPARSIFEQLKIISGVTAPDSSAITISWGFVTSEKFTKWLDLRKINKEAWFPSVPSGWNENSHHRVCNLSDGLIILSRRLHHQENRIGDSRRSPVTRMRTKLLHVDIVAYHVLSHFYYRYLWIVA